MSALPGKKFIGRLPGAIIVLAWLVVIGVLIARQRVTRPEAPSNEIPPALLEEQWMAVRFHGEKIGWGRSEYKPIPGGYLVTSESRLSIVALGVKQEAQTYLTAEVSPEFYLKKVYFDFRSSAQNIKVDGEVKDLVLNISIRSPAEAKPEERSIKLKEPICILDTMAIRAAKMGLKVGEKFRLPTFDPTTQTADYVNIEVVGREEIECMGKRVSAYVLKTNFMGVEVKSWIDDEGRSLRDESPLGFVTDLVTKADALKVEGAAKLDLIAAAAITSDRNIPDPRNLRYLKARLSGADNIEAPDLEGGVQSMQKQEGGSQVILTIRVPEPGTGYDLPDKEPAMESYLAPEPLLQSDDPDIISAAKDIIRGERNSVRAAKLLNDWLFEHIEKKPTLSLPSAREVWSAKQGDCNEHTALYTALARAAGIPARMAVGVVYIEGAFYYHAWPEVWMGQTGWVPVDPTFGEFPADATHIRLAIGGLKNQLAVTRFLGKLKIEIMEM